MIKRKGLALQTIGILIFTITSILLLLSLFSGPFRDVLTYSFCYFSFHLGIKPSICEGLEFETKTKCIAHISPSSKEELAKYLAAYALNCWNNLRKTFKEEREDMICCTLFLDNSISEGLSEEEFTRILEEEGACDALENLYVYDDKGKLKEYDGDCGLKEEIEWKIGNYVISNQKIILIKYNLKENKIIIQA